MARMGLEQKVVKGDWSAMGHIFDPNMRCKLCTRGWAAHQREPMACRRNEDGRIESAQAGEAESGSPETARATRTESHHVIAGRLGGLATARARAIAGERARDSST